MSFDPDISSDCILVDGTETVTLEAASNVVVAGAKRGVLNDCELLQRELGLTAEDLAWSLPGIHLAGVEPHAGDVVRDAALVRWTILTASQSPLTGVWRLVCWKQR